MTQPAPSGPPVQATGTPAGTTQQAAPPAQPQQQQYTPVQPQQQPQQPAQQGQQQYAPGGPVQQYQQPVQYTPVIPLPTAQPPAGDPGQNGDGGGGDGESDLSKLPQWAQKQIRDLRDESAKRRVEARNALVNQHAWMAAQQLGANANAVLGSLAWQQVAAQLDPSKADFARHLGEAIHQVMQQNPWMAAPQAQQPMPGQAPSIQQGQPGMPQPPAPGAPAVPGQPMPYPYPPVGYPPVPGQQPYGYGAYPPPAQPPAPSGVDFSGASQSAGPITEAQLAQMTPHQIQEAYEKGQLKHLL